MKSSRMVMLVLGAGLAVWSIGCADPDKVQVADLQRQNQQLERDNASLSQRIAQLMRDLDRLNKELEGARGQLSKLKELQPGWSQEGGIAWTDVADDILFDSGKSELKASGRQALQRIAAQIRNDKELSKRGIWIIGHTDTDPISISKDKWKDNLDLSCNRAMVVAREFYAMGFNAQHVVAGGQGEHNPKVDNNSRANKQNNRRVQIMAIQRPPSGLQTREAETNANRNAAPATPANEERG
ncbi:MAG: OmpA family protein [Phycisphaerales bacterium]|nr:OmpA family protein [Phycisphaerales bacterium]